METLESLSDALETTAQIKSIVRTMKSLSAVSIRQYEQAETALADYERTVELGLIALLNDRGARGLPLPATGGASAGREGLILIGSDRGLCGRYNETVTRFARPHLADRDTVVGVIGARAAARLEADGRRPDIVFALPASVAGLTGLVQSVIIEIDRWTQHRGVARARLIHNRREGRSTATPVSRPLLPLPDSYLRDLTQAKWPARTQPFMRMRPADLLSWLVQQRLFVVLYRALAEALASEHATRLAAMQSAERNIEERRDALTAAHRRKRQETITRELLDVVAGFEAVSTAGEDTPGEG